MDVLTTLPPDLAAIADPSARGTAPLLRPPDADGAPPASLLPFASLFELLTATRPSGEAWPAAGKELPLVPFDAAPLTMTETAATAEIAAMAVPSAAPVVPSAAPVVPSVDALAAPARPVAAAPAAPFSPTAAPGLPPLFDGALPTPPLPVAAKLEVLAAPTPLVSSDAEGAPLDFAMPRAADAPARAVSAATWLEAFVAHDVRRQTQMLAMPAAPRALTASVAALSVAPQSQAAAAPIPQVAELSLQNGARRADVAKLLHAVGASGEPATIGQAEWLPPAGAHGVATSVTAAAPTSASLPSTPVDMRTPHWQEAFASRVQLLVETHAGEARIKLNPPELGAVDVKISLVDDKTFVQLTAATAAARDELAQSLPRLRELLTVGGLEVGGASVHNGRDQQPGSDGYGAAAADSHAVATAVEGGGDAETFLPRRALGRIDLFA